MCDSKGLRLFCAVLAITNQLRSEDVLWPKFINLPEDVGSGVWRVEYICLKSSMLRWIPNEEKKQSFSKREDNLGCFEIVTVSSCDYLFKIIPRNEERELFQKVCFSRSGDAGLDGFRLAFPKHEPHPWWARICS